MIVEKLPNRVSMRFVVFIPIGMFVKPSAVCHDVDRIVAFNMETPSLHREGARNPLVVERAIEVEGDYHEFSFIPLVSPIARLSCMTTSPACCR